MSLRIKFNLLEAPQPKKPPAEEPIEHKPGDKMRDGTIFAGISPDTGKPMYTTPKDSSMWTFEDALKYAAHLRAHTRKDWRLPTKAELNVMFNNRAAIGGFDTRGYAHSGWYRASCGSGQSFDTGNYASLDKYYPSMMRPVR